MRGKIIVFALVFTLISLLSFNGSGFSDGEVDFRGVWVFGVALFSPIAIPVILAMSIFPSLLATKRENKITINLSAGILLFLAGTAIYSILIALLVMLG